MRNIIPEGTRDYTTEECKKRNGVTRELLSIFNSWGYDEVITPTIEFYNTFNNCEENIKEEEIYKFFDNNGSILVLRPDMTIPVARMASTKLKDRTAPIKICYSSNVFRVNESLLGRQNEFIDCGIELVGVEDKKSDLEILVTAIECIKGLGFDNFKLEIGNINILKDAMNAMSLNSSEKDKIAELIDKKSLATLGSYISELSLKENEKCFLKELPWLFGDGTVISKGKEVSINSEVANRISYLEELYSSLCKLGYEKYVSVDLAMVPRLNYYTGIIFRGYLEGIGDAILTGGRYDNLVKRFGRDLKAIGFSFKVDLITTLYNSKNQNTLEEIIIEGEDNVKALELSLDLIKAGKRLNRIY